MIIQFRADVAPRGKQRARTVRLPNGHTTSYTPRETVRFETAIAYAYKRTCRGSSFAPYEPLQMTVYEYMPIPQSVSKRKQEDLDGDWHTKKPDASNVLKSVEDALNKLAYADDGQIAALHVYKIYSTQPRIEVTIQKLQSRKEQNHGIDVNSVPCE